MSLNNSFKNNLESINRNQGTIKASKYKYALSL